MITQRVADPDLQDAVANGTIDHIVGHELASSAFHVSSIDGVSVHRHHQLPRHLLIHVKDCLHVLKQGYAPGVILVEPVHSRIDITLPTQASQKRKRGGPTMTVDPFPMIPAFACTPEKLQGQTCKDGIILAKLERGSRPLSPQALYVTFSRTISLSKLCLTEPISPLDVSRFKPTPDTVHEMLRLQQLMVLPSYFDATAILAFNSWKVSHLQM